MVRKTLIYVGEKYDAYFPWGGYHITITGRIDVPVDDAKSVVQRHVALFQKFNEDAGWILTKEKVTTYVPDENGKIMVYLQCDELNTFVNSLTFEPMLSNFKRNLHISMHTTDANAVDQKVNDWIENKHIFRIYVIDWECETGKTEWHQVTMSDC